MVSTSARYHVIIASLIVGFSVLCGAVAFVIFESFRTMDYGFFGMAEGRSFIVVIVAVVIACLLVAYALSDSLRKILRKINASAGRPQAQSCKCGYG